MPYLTDYNHNGHFDPHPQYNLYHTLVSKQAPDNDTLWVKMMEKTLRYDVTGLPNNQQDCLRRIGFDGYVFDNVSEAQMDYGLLHLYVYVSKHKQADGSYVVANLGLNPLYNDYTRYEKNNLFNPSFIFKLYVHDTGEKDATGIPVYTVSLYGKVQGNFSTITFQPTSLHLVNPNADNFDATDITTNPNAAGHERIDALLEPFVNSDYQKESVVEAAHNGDISYSTNHPVLPQSYEQVDRNNNGTGEVDLLPYTTMLTVAPKADFKTWPLKWIKPSPWQDQQGFELTVLTFGNVNFVNSALFAQENNEDGGVALKNKVDKIYDAGTVIKLIRYNNYWIQE
ncbi:hypothetical protein ABHC39_10165 [Pediococcus acidilactici]|uniref:hypothetical protein n=1 Tax=Pediococcus acidilactici TaxID=1254 RepID=UPI00232CCEE2|nr:hypothetical protein [Pediococcus acidilactici]MDB8868160.1 hypothetical protein [Pediococcus acidilactici]